MQPPRAKSPLQVEREKRLYANLQNESTTNGVSSQFNVRKPSDVQMSIKGMAASGPYVVVASNFAPGTTAADIEAAMVPVGGEITTCHLISAHPTVIVEIVFVEKEGAENVIATFNNQKVRSYHAESRVPHVRLTLFLKAMAINFYPRQMGGCYTFA